MRRFGGRAAGALVCAVAVCVGSRAGAEEDEASREHIVEVLTTTGQPLSGVRVLPVHGGYWVQFTDAKGQARFPWRGPSDQDERKVVIGDREHDLAPPGKVTRHRMEPCPGLRVDVVSAENGFPIEAERVRLRLSNLGYIDVPRVDGSYRLTAVSVGPATQPEFSVVVEGPQGWADAEVVAGDLQWAEPDDAGSLVPHVSALATLLVMTVPLRPATSVTVQAVNETGKPEAGAVVGSVRFQGSSVALRSRSEPAGADGLVVVRRVPKIAGERIVVKLTVPKTRLTGTSPAIDPGAPPESPPKVELEKERGSGMSFGVGRGSQHAFSSLRPRPPKDPVEGSDAASVEVLVKTRDGAPARRVVVRDLTSDAVLRTDDDGQATFEALAGGKHEFDVVEPGFVYASGSATLRRGERSSLTLTEGTARAVKIRVVDRDGKPVPFAALRVGYPNGFPFATRSGGDQPLTLHTNARGWHVLGGLPALELDVVAALGTRSVRAKIPAGAAEIRLVIP